MNSNQLPANFQNDWAMDWLGDFCESGDTSLIRSTINKVIEHGGTKFSAPSLLERLRGRNRHTDWLEARVAAKGLAAAEVVAAMRGCPSINLPENLMAWLQQHPSSFSPDLVPLAKKAVNIVMTSSELKDLWEEGDASNWKSAIANLDQRLN
jgi:hypothetical protein